MGTLAAGSVVLVPFPFSDLSASKLRPAIVLADAGKGDWIMCMVTSNVYADPKAIVLEGADFESGSLSRTSFVRPTKLFTAHASLVRNEAGRLTKAKLSEVLNVLATLFTA